MADTPHVIDETVILRGEDIYTVYEKCVEWIHKLGASNIWSLRNSRIKIVQENIPYQLIANHWIIRSEYISHASYKTITINLAKIEESITLQILLDIKDPEYIDSITNPKVVSVHWGYLVESLWKHLGVEPDFELLRRIYPKKYLGYDILLIVGFLLGIISLSFLFYTVLTQTQQNEMLLIYSFFGLFGLLNYPKLVRFVQIRKRLYSE